MESISGYYYIALLQMGSSFCKSFARIKEFVTIIFFRVKPVVDIKIEPVSRVYINCLGIHVDLILFLVCGLLVFRLLFRFKSILLPRELRSCV